MCDRRQHRAFIRPHRIHLLHERVGGCIHEVFVQSFLENGRREGAEFLAELDLGIDEIAHIRATRIGEDAAVTQCARAPFHAPLEPAHHVAVRDEPRGHSADLALIFHVRLHVAPLIILPRGNNRAEVEPRIGGSPVAVLHDERPWMAEHLVPYVVGGAEGGTVVAGCGLNVELLKGCVGAHLAVRHAVHGATAGETQPRVLRPLPKPVKNVKCAFLVHGLERAREIFVALRKWLVLFSRRTQEPLQLVGIDAAHGRVPLIPFHLYVITPMAKVLEC